MFAGHFIDFICLSWIKDFILFALRQGAILFWKWLHYQTNFLSTVCENCPINIFKNQIILTKNVLQIENLAECLEFFFFFLLNLLQVILPFSLEQKLFKRAFAEFQTNILFIFFHWWSLSHVSKLKRRKQSLLNQFTNDYIIILNKNL